jgi:hypothetical protein
VRQALVTLVRRPETALFALVFGAYAYFYQAGGWNQNSRFDLTRSVVERGTSQIDAYHRNTGDKARRGDHYYCDKAPAVSWLGVPPYAALYAAAGSPETLSPRLLATGAYLAAVFGVGLPSAFAVVMLFSLALRLGASRALGAALALAYGLGTLAFPYSTLLYGHQLIAALHLIAFALVASLGRAEAPPCSVRLFLVGLLLGTSVVAEYPAALTVLVLCAYAAVVIRPWPKLLWIVAGGALPALALALYHATAFGSPLALPYAFSTQKYRHGGFFMGLGVPRLSIVYRILFPEYRGLFFSAPWLLVGVPGLVLLVRHKAMRAEGVVCAAVVLLFLWLNASLVIDDIDWIGGWTLGPRYLIPMLPFLALGTLGVARALTPYPRTSALLGAGAALAVALSIFLMLAGTAVKPEVPVQVKRPFRAYLLPAFYAGNLSLNPQSINDAGFRPGDPPQAWNLGQLAGLRGKASLLPLACYGLGTAVWLVFTLWALRRPRRAA